MIDRFKAKGYVDGGIITNKRDEQLDMAAMPPILRALLVTDGTVTKTLEAFFWEPLKIIQLGQSMITLEEDILEMDCLKGQEVLKRKVSINGERSGDIYAYATSILDLNILPVDVRKQLIAGNIGIGELLRDKGLETYRQVYDVFREIKHEVVPNSHSNYHGELICRAYNIFLHHRPAIQVTEKFPIRLYHKKIPY